MNNNLEIAEGKESLGLRFLYRTLIGRCILKILVRPGVSKASTLFFSSKLSAGMIASFVRKNGIQMERFEIPVRGYASFNDFFTRKMKPEYYVKSEANLRCPSDALLTVCEIDEDSAFSIKHAVYSLERLLEDKELAKTFVGGRACIFRLTPSHYHRYAYAAGGEVVCRKRIEGILHCVRPIAVEHIPVFTQNSREYVVIDSPLYGKVVQMEVGALLVGKITNLHKEDAPETATVGAEKGYFEYGGSTIVVLLQKGVALEEELLRREKVFGEIPVQIGESLG